MPTKVRSRPAVEQTASPRPVRTVSATLELDGYTGWTARMQSNAALRVLDDLDRTDDFDAMKAALIELVRSHTFPVKGDLNRELNAEEVWALRRAYIKALNEATTPSKS